MNKIKAIIVDDELMARNLLNGIIEESCPQIEVMESCVNLADAVKSIRNHQPDIVFLDIEMPGHSGLELLDFFNESEIDFSIIFTTAYNQYAINAFKLSAIDYLLKPLDAESIINAIQRFEKSISNKSTLELLRNNLKPTSVKKLAIHTVSSIDFIILDEIAFLKADGAYTQIVLNDDSKILSSKNMKYFEEVLQSNEKFIRCHKSYIVNVTAISSYVKTDGGSLVVNKTHEIGISSSKIDEILALLSIRM